MKINESELQQIIKEEAIRLKKKMMLEAERSAILKTLKEMEECDLQEVEMEEGLFSKKDWPAEAEQWINQPNIKPALKAKADNIWANILKNPSLDWFQKIAAGKNLQDKAQLTEVYRAWLDYYKNQWKAVYINGQGTPIGYEFNMEKGILEKTASSGGGGNFMPGT